MDAVRELPVTVTAGDTTSAEINLKNFTICGIFFPADFVGTTITFLAATTAGGTFVEVQDGAGAVVTITAGASKYARVDPAFFAGLQHVKIKCGSTQTSTDKVLTLAARQLV